MNRYQNPETAKKYLDYLDSADGKLQREILSAAIFEQLPEDTSVRILDAACGTGWLTIELAKQYDSVQGFDSSEFFLHHAKQNHPELNLTKSDLLGEIPYPDSYFDTVICNMAASDVDDLEKLYSNLSRIVQPSGTLIITIPNPSYAFPVGIWKRGLLRWIFRRKPVLKLRPWSKFLQGKKLSWDNTFSGFFHPLEAQLKNAKLAGFALEELKELRSEKDSDDYNLQYRLFRYPLFVLLTFVKRAE